MKIDKDFAVKVEGRIFTGTEIDKIVINGGKFNMVCTYTNGSKFEVHAYTKDVEFLSNTPVYGLQVEEELLKSVFGDKVRRWIVYESDKSNNDSEITTENVKQAISEYMEQMGETIKVDCSIDGEQFAKLIKKYNQDITRSGG